MALVTKISIPCLLCQSTLRRSISTTVCLNRLRSEWRVDRKPANTLLSSEDILEERKAFGGRKKVKAISISKGTFTLPGQDFESLLPIVDVLHSDAGPQYREKKILAKGTFVTLDISEHKEKIDIKKLANSLNQTEICVEQLQSLYQEGKLYGKITTRPGQVGKCDGIILENNELENLFGKLKLYDVDASL